MFEKCLLRFLDDMRKVSDFEESLCREFILKHPEQEFEQTFTCLFVCLVDFISGERKVETF
jgi:hypothetical protein